MINSSSKKIFIFVITNLGFQFLIGQLGVYSIIMPSFSAQFGYDDATLGIFDAIATTGNVIGSFFILFTSVSPSKGFLVYSILNVLFGIILFFPKYIESILLRDLLVYSCFFFQQFLISSIAYTQIIFSQYYSKQEELAHSIWSAFTFIGQIISLAYAQLMVYDFGFKWQSTKIIWSSGLLLISVIIYLFLKDQQKQAELICDILSLDSNNEDSLRKDIEIMENDRDSSTTKRSILQILCSISLLFVKLLSELKICVLVLSFSFISANYLSILQWTPYYYVTAHQESYSLIIILVITACCSIGPVILQVIIYRILNLQKHQKKITSVLTVFGFISFIFVWINKENDPFSQLLFLALAFFLIGSPSNRICSAEVVLLGQNNQKRISNIFLLAHLCKNIVLFIQFLVLGRVMQISHTKFWSFLIIIYSIWFFIEGIRVFLTWGKQTQNS